MVVREEVGGGEIDEARYLLMTNVASEPSLSNFAAPAGKKCPRECVDSFCASELPWNSTKSVLQVLNDFSTLDTHELAIESTTDVDLFQKLLVASVVYVGRRLQCCLESKPLHPAYTSIVLPVSIR